MRDKTTLQVKQAHIHKITLYTGKNRDEVLLPQMLEMKVRIHGLVTFFT